MDNVKAPVEIVLLGIWMNSVVESKVIWFGIREQLLH